MKVSNMIICKYDTGETLAMYELDFDCVSIKNCRLLKSAKYNRYYISTPQQKYINDYGCKDYYNFIIIKNQATRNEILKLALDEYTRIIQNIN